MRGRREERVRLMRRENAPFANVLVNKKLELNIRLYAGDGLVTRASCETPLDRQAPSESFHDRVTLHEPNSSNWTLWRLSAGWEPEYAG
jgi:hypothetical protein